MALFMIIIDEPSDDVGARIKKVYAESYPYHSANGVYIVRSEDTTGTICEKIGIKGDDKDISGAVFKLNSAYSGHTKGDLWEWLEDE